MESNDYYKLLRYHFKTFLENDYYGLEQRINEMYAGDVQEIRANERNKTMFEYKMFFVQKLESINRKISELFKTAYIINHPENYPKIIKNIEDFKSARINNISQYEYEISISFESLFNWVNVIQRLETNNDYTTAIYLKNFCINRLSTAKQFFINIGVKFNECQFAKLYDDLINKVSESVNIEEIKLIRDLQSLNIEKVENKINDISERDFSKNDENENIKNGIKKITSQKIETETTDKILKIANVVFLADVEKLDLLRYFAENFTGYRKDFTELTKFNQIYFYFNYLQKVPKQPYQKLIMEMFGFDYENSEIKGENLTHQTTLKNLHVNFNKQI